MEKGENENGMLKKLPHSKITGCEIFHAPYSESIIAQLKKKG